MSLTNNQTQFLALVSKYEELKKQMKEIKPQLQEMMLSIGENEMFQDPETELVYKIIKPTGTFISFDPISYVRTKKPDETRGSLSKKEATEAGFSISK